MQKDKPVPSSEAMWRYWHSAWILLVEAVLRVLRAITLLYLSMVKRFRQPVASKGAARFQSSHSAYPAPTAFAVSEHDMSHLSSAAFVKATLERLDALSGGSGSVPVAFYDDQPNMTNASPEIFDGEPSKPIFDDTPRVRKEHHVTMISRNDARHKHFVEFVDRLASELQSLYPNFVIYNPIIWAAGTGGGFDWHTDNDAFMLPGSLQAWMNLWCSDDCNHGLEVADVRVAGLSSGCIVGPFDCSLSPEAGLKAHRVRIPPASRCNWAPFVLNLFPLGSIHRTVCCSGETAGHGAIGRRVTLAFRMTPKHLILDTEAVLRLRTLANLDIETLATAISEATRVRAAKGDPLQLYSGTAQTIQQLACRRAVKGAIEQAAPAVSLCEFMALLIRMTLAYCASDHFVAELDSFGFAHNSRWEVMQSYNAATGSHFLRKANCHALWAIAWLEEQVWPAVKATVMQGLLRRAPPRRRYGVMQPGEQWGAP